MTSQQQDETNNLLQIYLANKRILVADPGTTTRAMLAKQFLDFGAKQQQVTLVPDYQNALNAIKENFPTIVIAEYELKGGSGIDLFNQIKQDSNYKKSSIHILVTANTSQAAVARAAEEDVDAFVIKPFTPGVLKNTVANVIQLKTKPSEYVQKIEKGKELLESNNIESAIAEFQAATHLNDSPTLALGYLGHVHFIKDSLDLSEQEFSKGLNLNKIHYKCLIGMFDLLMKQQRHKEAYEVVKKVSQYFPANPKRLTTVLRLAIQTKSYEDVERYYRLFTTIDLRNEDMVRYICAALIVCGKHYLQNNAQSRALEVLDRAATTAQHRTRFLREIISTLLEAKQAKNAENFLKRFPPATQSSSEYKICQVAIYDALGQANKVLELGRALIAEKIEDPLLYESVIRQSALAGLKSAAEDLAQKASALWPDKKTHWDRESKLDKKLSA